MALAKKKVAKAKKADYRVLSANTVDGLEKKVSDYIGKGFKPVGGITVAFPPFDALEGRISERVAELFQAVLKDG